MVNTPRAATQDVSSDQGNERPPALQPPQSDPDRLVPGHFHATSLDAPAVSTNRPENIVSTAGAPVIYYPVYQTSRTVVVQRAVQPGTVRTVTVAPQRIVPSRIPPLPRGTPPSTINHN